MKNPARMTMVLIVLAGLLLVADFEARCMDRLMEQSQDDRQAINWMEWDQIAPMQRSWQGYYVSGVDAEGIRNQKR